MILEAFTIFHVLLSLAGIGSGLVVVYGLLTSRTLDRWTTAFFITNMATSVTGYMFPFHGVTPGHVVGVLALGSLGVGRLARWSHRLSGRWRAVYAVSVVFALYLNVFVLIVQIFRRVPALRVLAPTQTEPAFQITQLVTLIAFVVLGILSTMRFHVRTPATEPPSVPGDATGLRNMTKRVRA
jgi:hypothetical protein